MKNIEEYIHLLALFLSPLLIFGSYYFGVHKEILEFIVIPIAILLSISLLIRGTYINKEEEIHLFRTFFFDTVYTTKLGRELIFNVDIFIIEAEGHHNSFAHSVKTHFSKEIGRSNLTVKSFDWD